MQAHHDGTSHITYRTEWADAVKSLREDPAFADDAAFNGADDMAIFDAYESYIMDLEKERMDRMRRERDAEKRVLRHARGNFIRLLASDDP